MSSPISLDAVTAVSYIGQTALMELRWDDEARARRCAARSLTSL